MFGDSCWHDGHVEHHDWVPHGGHTSRVKQFEAEQAIADGCQELDMVVNISKVLSGDWDYVTRDIEGVIQVAHAAKRKVKVIFENLLTCKMRTRFASARFARN